MPFKTPTPSPISQPTVSPRRRIRGLPVPCTNPVVPDPGNDAAAMPKPSTRATKAKREKRQPSSVQIGEPNGNAADPMADVATTVFDVDDSEFDDGPWDDADQDGSDEEPTYEAV